MRLEGRFARRVRAFAAASGIPVIECTRGERKHLIAEEYLRTHSVGPGVFMILVARAPATVWDVRRSADGRVIGAIAKKTSHVNHYSFHIMDPVWGHLTIKMSGHPPFAAQVILNGHEYVAVAAQGEEIGFVKEGNCFTGIADPQRLARVADTLSQPAAIGRLGQVCDRWIYSACLCFGLDLDEQARTGFRYAYSVYQVEYSRNLIFRDGRQLDRLFNTVADRARSRLDVPAVRTLSGARRRPGKYGTRGLSPRLGVVIETPAWDLTVFKAHFGLLTLKAYSKGEHVLRFEAIALEKFPEIVTRLAGMAGRFCTALDCVHTAFIADGMLDELPRPAQLGKMRVGGIDLNKPRIRAVLQAVLALAAAPAGFTVADLTAKVCAMTGQQDYTARQAGYDLRKLRGKGLVARLGRTRRYHVPPLAARTITALLALRDQVIAPILAGIRSPQRKGRQPASWTAVDRDYENLRIGMQSLFQHLGIHAAIPAA